MNSCFGEKMCYNEPKPMILTSDNLETLNTLRNADLCNPVQWIVENYKLGNIRPSQVLRMADEFKLTPADLKALTKKIKPRGLVIPKATSSFFTHPEFVLRESDDPLTIQKVGDKYEITFFEEYGFLIVGYEKRTITFASKSLYFTPADKLNRGILIFETQEKDLKKALEKKFAVFSSIDGGYAIEGEIACDRVSKMNLDIRIDEKSYPERYPAIKICL